MYRFQVSCDTQWGEEVCIVGCSSCLGSWNVSQAIVLKPLHYPLWKSDEIDVSDVGPPEEACSSSKRLEYKYVIRGPHGVKWEHGKNRWAPIEIGTRLTVHDGCFGHIQPYPEFQKEYRSPILVHPYALTLLGDTLYASTQDSGTVVGFNLTESNQLSSGDRINFNLKGDFRYRPGITYRGIASYKKCLYLSVTEMDVVAVICDLDSVSHRIPVRHPVGLMVDEERKELYIASPSPGHHKHQAGSGQGEILVVDLEDSYKFMPQLLDHGPHQERLKDAVAHLKPDIIIIALSLGNEGLAHCLLDLISMALSMDAMPVLGGVYPNNDYNAETYAMLKDGSVGSKGPKRSCRGRLEPWQHGMFPFSSGFQSLRMGTGGGRTDMGRVLLLKKQSGAATGPPVFEDGRGFSVVLCRGAISIRNKTTHEYVVSADVQELSEALVAAGLRPGIYEPAVLQIVRWQQSECPMALVLPPWSLTPNCMWQRFAVILRAASDYRYAKALLQGRPSLPWLRSWQEKRADPQLYWAHPLSHASGAPDLYTPLSSVLLASPRHRLAAMLQKWGLAEAFHTGVAGVPPEAAVTSLSHKKAALQFLELPVTSLGEGWGHATILESYAVGVAQEFVPWSSING
eukprot:g28076.t1